MNQQTLNFYNKFSVCYPVIDFFLLPQKRVLASTVNELPTGNLLEVGVGNGSHLKYYSKHQLTGIDISSAMLDTAKKLNTNEIALYEMNGEKLSYRSEHV